MRLSVPAKNIFIGGFSQGAALALFTSVTIAQPLGGAFVLGGYLPLAMRIQQHRAPNAGVLGNQTPIFMGHGDADEIVKYDWAQISAEFLRTGLGQTISFKVYE